MVWNIFLHLALFILWCLHAIYLLEILAAILGASLLSAMPFLNPISPAIGTAKVAAGIGELIALELPGAPVDGYAHRHAGREWSLA